MSDIKRRNILQQSFLDELNSDDGSVDVESTQSLIASVRKQEEQFALLTKEIEDERKTCADQLKNNKEFQTNGSNSRSHEPHVDNNSDTDDEQSEIFIDENGVPRVIMLSDEASEDNSMKQFPHSHKKDSTSLTSSLRNPSSIFNSIPSVPPEQIQIEDYGLEDDKRSDKSDDVSDYGLNPIHRKQSNNSSTDSNESRYEAQLKNNQSNEPLKKLNHYNSAPLAIHEVPSRRSLNRIGKNWKIPTLQEVIAMLSYTITEVQENAAAYLQHLCYGDDKVKKSVRQLGGIYPLIKLLESDEDKIVWNACGALRNISYGRRNDKNKLKMTQYDAVPALVKIVRSSSDSDLKEQATGTLLNLSAHPEVKGQVIELGLDVLTKHVIAPYATMTLDVDSKLDDIMMFDVFLNSVAIIRNLSSVDSPEIRRKIRNCNQLLLSIISVLRLNSEAGDVDNKSTEHCVCILRNLTYKLQVETSNWKLYSSDRSASKESSLSNVFCLKKKTTREQANSTLDDFERIQDNPFARNAELLWQPSMAHLYMHLLEDSRDHDVIEALLGSIQNLTHGVWKWAAYTRYAVRIEKGLPVILDFLGFDNDNIVLSAAITLSNLAEDYKNKQLIGKYGMKKLTQTLPETPYIACPLSERSFIAVVHCLRSLVSKSIDNVKCFSESGGVERVMSIKNGNYHPKIVKACELLLLAMWKDKASKLYLKKQGWNKHHFSTVHQVKRKRTKPFQFH